MPYVLNFGKAQNFNKTPEIELDYVNTLNNIPLKFNRTLFKSNPKKYNKHKSKKYKVKIPNNIKNNINIKY